MSIIGSVYKWLPNAFIEQISRPLPKRIGVYNGVAVRDVPFFRERDFQPYKKQVLWNAVRDVSRPGDSHLYIGGGKGIVPIRAALAGHDVTVIEGGKELVTQLEQTAGLNSVDLDVRHGIVGDPSRVWGDATKADVIEPESLTADVAILDCEGAERTILPLRHVRTVVIETHPMYGVTESEIRELTLAKTDSYGRNAHGGQVLIRS